MMEMLYIYFVQYYFHQPYVLTKLLKGGQYDWETEF